MPSDVDLAQVKWDSQSATPQASTNIDVNQVKWDSTPANSPQQDSVATQGLDYLHQHPFKSILQGLPETLTGTSMANRMQDSIQQNIPQANQRPFDSNIAQAQKDEPGIVQAKTEAGIMGSVADQALTPANYTPLPIAEIAGKIPVGATNLGRIASNIGVGSGFRQGVKDMQALDSHLEQIGKTSSPGIKTGSNYNPAVNQTIMAAHNEMTKPTAGQFKQPSQITTYNDKVVKGYQTINDYLGGAKPQSLQDALDASSSTLQDIYKTYTAQAKDATAGGATVDLGDIANKVLSPMVDPKNPLSAQIATYRPGLIPKINALIENYSKRGDIPVTEAQGDVEILNQDIKKYIRAGNFDDQSMGAINLALSQAIREQSSKEIMDSLGSGGYQDLRNQYGAVSEVQKGLTRALAKQLSSSGGLSHPLLDVASGVDVGNAILKGFTGNPVGAAKDTGLAVIYQGVKKALDVIRSPDRKIQAIFQLLDRAKVNPSQVNPLSKSFKNMGNTINPVNNIGNSDMQGVGEQFAQPGISSNPAQANLGLSKELSRAEGEGMVQQIQGEHQAFEANPRNAKIINSPEYISTKKDVLDSIDQLQKMGVNQQVIDTIIKKSKNIGGYTDGG